MFSLRFRKHSLAFGRLPVLGYGKQSWNVVAEAGTRLLFFYSEYFGRLLSCNEHSEISQRECVLWDAHLMEQCVQSEICAYITQDTSQNESLIDNFNYINAGKTITKFCVVYDCWICLTILGTLSMLSHFEICVYSKITVQFDFWWKINSGTVV